MEFPKPTTVFIGVKVIRAIAMTRQKYNDFRGWTTPSDECGDDPGYLVEYLDGGKPNVKGFDNYVSWSPADVFERAYRSTGGMTFGLAIEAMKQGLKVCRAGWNGKGMWICLSPGYKDLKAESFWAKHNREVAEKNGGKADVLPYITMKTVNNEILCGWLASQTDMLAEDWQIAG